MRTLVMSLSGLAAGLLVLAGSASAAAVQTAPPAASAQNAESIAAAMKVLDDFMTAFNARDVAAYDKTFNFPSVRLASNTLTILQPGSHKPEMFTTGSLKEWDHSAWQKREVIHAGPDKVHINTRFARFRKDGSVLGGFDSIYVVTKVNGHWGIKARSSYAP